jgi:hypothetical protein
VLDRQQANYDLFCNREWLNEEISAAKAAVEQLTRKSRCVSVNFKTVVSADTTGINHLQLLVEVAG